MKISAKIVAFHTILMIDNLLNCFVVVNYVQFVMKTALKSIELDVLITKETSLNTWQYPWTSLRCSVSKLNKQAIRSFVKATLKKWLSTTCLVITNSYARSVWLNNILANSKGRLWLALEGQKLKYCWMKSA